ncbi:MAG TPA: hypothetical protein VMG08_10760 [Allosphingosinicella sp.]|nr:hypothetical protein [Allosphingosinicella sp.]
MSLSIRPAFEVVDAADEFVRQTAASSAETIAVRARLATPGHRHVGSQTVDFAGECPYEDGEFLMRGLSTRIVNFGAPGEGLAATEVLDGGFAGSRKDLQDAAEGDLLALLAFADRNRFAATRLLQQAACTRPKMVARIISTRGLATQNEAERRLTEVLLSRSFLKSCDSAVSGSLQRYARVLKAQLGRIHEQAFQLFMAGAVLGLVLMPLLLLVPMDARPGQGGRLFLYLAWCAALASISGIHIWLRRRRVFRVEEEALGKKAEPKILSPPQ